MIQAFYDKWKDKGVNVVTVSVDQDTATLTRFMEGQKLSYPVLTDLKQVTARSFQLEYVPTTFFIDKDGIIRDKVVGGFENVANIESSLKKAMP